MGIHKSQLQQSEKVLQVARDILNFNMCQSRALTGATTFILSVDGNISIRKKPKEIQPIRTFETAHFIQVPLNASDENSLQDIYFLHG